VLELPTNPIPQIMEPWLLKALATGPTLFMGLGCFLWVPLSIGIGRRPALLIASVVSLFAMIWAAESRSFGSLVMAMCFVGLGEGLSLSLVGVFTGPSMPALAHQLTIMYRPS